MSSKVVSKNQPCPKCTSSDAYQIYDDGHGHCFSCGHHTWPNKKPEGEKLIYTEEHLPWRGITKETFQKFGVTTQINSAGTPIRLAIPFPSGLQYRWLNEKKFLSEGDMSKGQLFGQDRFPAGSSKSITIYEGALDAMSGYQMLGGWPSVSVRSATSAKKDCGENWDYLNSFEEIYLAFDDDEPGQTAAKTVAGMFDFNKVKLVKLSPFKDANDFLTAGRGADFKRVWWNAKRLIPENIASSFTEIDEILDQKRPDSLVEYPFKRLQDMTYGLRPGEAVLIKAPEGIGKTEFIRAIEYKIIKETDYNIGIIHLEEPQSRSVMGLVGYELGVPVHFPDTGVTLDQMKGTYRKLVQRDNRVHYYSHFGSVEPDEILSSIRFLVSVCGCKFIFLDHISILVSGLATEDERKTLDYLTTNLRMLSEELQFVFVFISHVNDDGLTRGSRNTSKIADLVISIDRDKLSEDEATRNTTYITVEKNRFGSHTGPAGSVVFDIGTFKLTDTEDTFGIPTR